MSKSKKIIGIVLAVVMAFSCMTMAFGAFAAGETNTLTLGLRPNRPVEINGSTKLEVTLTTNYNVGVFSIPIFYEKVEGMTVTAAPKGNYTVTTDADAQDKAAVYADAGLDEATYGFIRISFIPKAGDNALRANSPIKPANITIENKSAVAGATARFFTLDATRKSPSNQDGFLYIGKVPGAVVTIDPENVVAGTLAAETTVQLGVSAAKPELVTKSTGKVAVYNGVNYIYGVAPLLDEQGLAAYFGAKDGKLVWTAPQGGTLGGTGTKCELKSNSGDLVETYILILFGDVDKDGNVTTGDGNLVTTFGKGDSSAIADAACQLAANVDGDPSVTTGDGNLVTTCGKGDSSAFSQTVGFPAP